MLHAINLAELESGELSQLPFFSLGTSQGENQFQRVFLSLKQPLNLGLHILISFIIDLSSEPVIGMNCQINIYTKY